MAGGGSDGAELSGRLQGGRRGLDRGEAARAAAAEAETPKKKTSSRDIKETPVWLLVLFPLTKVSGKKGPDRANLANMDRLSLTRPRIVLFSAPLNHMLMLRIVVVERFHLFPVIQ